MAYFNIGNFTANIANKGYAKSNKFEAEILFPATIPSANLSSRVVSLKVKSLTLPGRNLTTTTNDTIYGPTHELVGGLSYADSIDVTFYLSQDLNEKKRFDNWQENIYSPTTYELNFYEDYVGTMNIYQLGDDLERTYGVSLKEVFPKTVNPLEYSNDNNSGVLDLQVSFAFKEWEELTVTRAAQTARPKTQPPSVSQETQITLRPSKTSEADPSYLPNQYTTPAERGDEKKFPTMDVDTGESA